MEYLSKDDALNKFYMLAQDFIDELYGICYRREQKGYTNKESIKDSDKIKYAKTVIFAEHDANSLANHYIRFVLPHRKQVEDRNEQFFLNNDDIYPSVDSKYLAFLKDLWTNKSSWGMNQQEKTYTWQYFDLMIDAVTKWKNWDDKK